MEEQMKKKNRPAGKILMALMILFFYVPIIYMIIFSFNDGKSLTSFEGFSLRWYRHMLESQDMMDALYTTFSVALIATAVSTVVGTISAIGLSKSRKIVRDVVNQVNNLPMMNPEIVTAIGFMLLFITFKIEKGYVTMLLAHIAFCIPYVMLSVMPRLRLLDPNLADAAMDLGATPWQALRKVIVPQITPGIVSGGLIAFTMSVDDFIISYFVTGGGVKNLSIVVYTMSKRVNPSINAISTLVVVIITIALVIINVAPLIAAKRKKKDVIGRRRRWVPAVAGVAALALLVCAVNLRGGGGDRPFEGQTLHIYNWGEYTGENIIGDFEEETGATVVMDNFDSNEQMYIKVANQEPYDLLVPSDYMIQRLIEEDLLQKLDKSKLDCMDELTDAVKGLPYDPDNDYSVPYFWGTVGIVYDKTKVDIEDLEREGFNIFLDEKYKGDVYLYDSERDSFMMALKALGYSMNTENEQELQEAYEWLVQCVETMDTEIVTDEIIDNMAQGRKALGLIYSGDATYVMAENENMGYYMPETGTNLWSDAMVIPKNAENPDLAHAFINYATSYDGAYDNSSYVGYTSANEEVMEDLSGEGGDYEGINAYIPRSDNPNDEVFVYNENTKKIISELWSKVKIAASNAG
ncbi:extracellular solute-binding protein [Clostridium sp. Marseille-P3244]|uniref:extracellular solute-binding protein n=1 Tax=Clostridium sp. Marseille-P3244 TaxID=1871020 RepID=UPI000AABC6D1|nr:extracellular solute-binding protein [Clostridium sp. Marseille-P3244]